MQNDSDAALVQAARSGDKAAYAALIARHRRTVASLCRRMLDDPGLAEDATQEAIITAMVELDRLRDPHRFGAWLAGIGLNVCRRWLRHERRRRITGNGSEAPDPASLAEAAEVTDRVRRAVAALPSGQRAAVAGFYLQDLTQAEVAAELGIPVSAVKTRLHKARAALRVQLADLREEPTMPSENLVPVRIADIQRIPAQEGEFDPHVVILAETDGDRRLPIWIGPPEATALALTLQAVEYPRPPTYRFAADLITASGGRVTGCRVTRLEGKIFYAEVLVDGAAGQRVVDARPSDAMNLALVVDVPLSLDPALFGSGGDCEPPAEGTSIIGTPPSPQG